MAQFDTLFHPRPMFFCHWYLLCILFPWQVR